MYNGVPSDVVTSRSGATQSSVLGARDGIVTRGIVLDIAAVRGQPWLKPGEGVYPEDLEAAEEAQGIRVRSGDFVLLNTGYSRQLSEEGPVSISEGQPGWQAACLPWLHEREVSGIGSDTANDVTPSNYKEIPNPMHVVGIVTMGLWLLDNCNLVQCIEMCQRLQRWEFLFVLGPLRLEGGTGSPANPLALF
jgi:kynurenine formamidase